MDQTSNTLTHVLEYEVNVFVVIGPMDVEQSDNVGVIAKMLQEHDFTECSLGVGLIPESVCKKHRGGGSIKISSNIMGRSISHESLAPSATTMSTTTKHSLYNPIAPVCDMNRKDRNFFPNSFSPE
jgi:hypothetical protein